MPSHRTGYEKALVNAFFFEQDQQLLKAFHERLERMDRRTQLAQVSGIHDEAVLDRLVELEIAPEELAAMAVVPLVHVAWADRQIQTEERAAIIGAAQAAGIQPQDGRYPLLEHWLTKRPSAELIEAWKHYIKGLCRRLNDREAEELQSDVLALAQKVAQAAGGFLGFGNKISAAERSALDELEGAFSRGRD
jgi:hypothetical protein